jgi:hypothetical protein
MRSFALDQTTEKADGCVRVLEFVCLGFGNCVCSAAYAHCLCEEAEDLNW